MGLFASKENSTPATQPTPDASGKKGKATPTRKEAEAARIKQIHPPTDKKTAKAKARQATVSERDRQLSLIERTPGRTLMRDFIDSRFSVGEYSLPVILVLIVITFIFSSRFQWLQQPLLYLTWLVLIALVVDTFVWWSRFKKLAKERIPNENLRGLLYYGFNRSTGLRRFRTPAPRVDRGATI